MRCLLALVLLLLFPLCLLADRPIQTIRIRTTVPPVFKMDVPGMDGFGRKEFQGTLSIRDVGEDYSELYIPHAIEIRNLMSNAPVYIQVRLLRWNPPSPLDRYSVPHPPDHDLQMRVNPPWRQSGVLEVVSPYQGFGSITTRASDLLKAGESRGGRKVGVKGGSADIDARIVFGHGQAVPGDYTVEVEITVRAQP